MRPRVFAGLLAAGVTVLLASCTSATALSTAELQAVPDSHLYYPGSHAVRMSSVAQEVAQLNAASVDGFVATTLTTSASGEAVLAWYQRMLPSHGWTYRAREPHGDVYDGHPVPPAYLFTRGTQEVFSLTLDPTANDYIITYVALFDHCDTTPPYPLGPGNCDNGHPQ
jgi:hypothetical protein